MCVFVCMDHYFCGRHRIKLSLAQLVDSSQSKSLSIYQWLRNDSSFANNLIAPYHSQLALVTTKTLLRLSSTWFPWKTRRADPSMNIVFAILPVLVRLSLNVELLDMLYDPIRFLSPIFNICSFSEDSHVSWWIHLLVTNEHRETSRRISTTKYLKKFPNLSL